VRVLIEKSSMRPRLAGAILGVATSLAITASAQTGLPIVGALIFPVGFVMIVLLGLELVTGNFAVMPLGQLRHTVTTTEVLRNWTWVFVGNLLGSLAYGVLLAATLTMTWSTPAGGIAEKIVAAAELKTLAYASHGAAGLATAFIKAMLCNWMVCMGVVMGLVASSTVSKIVAAWLPITVFFAHGFEHAVVNMFLIPTGMLLGAKTGLPEWWLWNQIPVTLGNFAGGFLFTGLALYVTYGVKAPAPTQERPAPDGERPLAPVAP
jgi:formate/nitrite transporter